MGVLDEEGILAEDEVYVATNTLESDTLFGQWGCWRCCEKTALENQQLATRFQ
eukprot:Awhi_evm1s13526